MPFMPNRLMPEPIRCRIWQAADAILTGSRRRGATVAWNTKITDDRTEGVPVTPVTNVNATVPPDGCLTLGPVGPIRVGGAG